MGTTGNDPITLPILGEKKLPPSQQHLVGRINLFEKIPLLKRFAKWRGFQFAITLPNLVLFAIFIFAGIFGTPVGSHNIIIVFVWILWWFILIAMMVPFMGRIWCAMCPLPTIGDWIQRRAIFGVRPGKSKGIRNEMFGQNQRWPKQLSNIWLQNFGFLALASFSAMLVTRPVFSSIVLGGLILLAAGLAVRYRQRAFCNYVCPISGFLSLYAMSGTVELRSNDKDVCLKCTSKACAAGSEQGWACPWFVYMGKLDRSNYCGLCMECVKSCPNDNISLFARPFGADRKIKGYDEAWKAFIMLTLAFVYSLVLLGPWGIVKDFANVTETGNILGFLGYVGSVWFTCLIGVPTLFYLAVRLSKWFAGARELSTKTIFLQYAYSLVPLGLLVWIAFSVPLIMVNGSYIISVISDPMGWGWNLFRTAGFSWKPFLPEYVPHLQVGILLIGLVTAISATLKNSESLFERVDQRVKGAIPVTFFLMAVTLAFARLFVG